MREIKEIYEALHNRIIAELQKVNSDLIEARTGFESAFALSHAGEIRLLELLILQLSKELTPLTAQSLVNSQIGTLEKYGEIKGVLRGENESLENYRKRVVAAYDELAQVGTKADFRTWARQIRGIKEAYPYSAFCQAVDNIPTLALGLGFPVIYIEYESETTDKTAVINEYLKLLTKRATLCGGQIQICDMVEVGVSLSCSFLNPLTAPTAAKNAQHAARVRAVEEIADEYFSTKRPYIEGLDAADNSRINANEILFQHNSSRAVNNGAYLKDLRLTINGQVMSSYTLQAGEIAKII